MHNKERHKYSNNKRQKQIEFVSSSNDLTSLPALHFLASENEEFYSLQILADIIFILFLNSHFLIIFSHFLVIAPHFLKFASHVLTIASHFLILPFLRARNAFCSLSVFAAVSRCHIGSLPLGFCSWPEHSFYLIMS